jgi:hypothetical protein
VSSVGCMGGLVFSANREESPDETAGFDG